MNALSDLASSLGDINKSMVWILGCLEEEVTTDLGNYFFF